MKFLQPKRLPRSNDLRLGGAEGLAAGLALAAEALASYSRRRRGLAANRLVPASEAGQEEGHGTRAAAAAR